MDTQKNSPHADEQIELIEWYNLTQSPAWDATVASRANEGMARAVYVCCDPSADEKERFVAMGEAKVWAEIRTWKEKYQIAFDEMKEYQAGEPDTLVGSKASEQWYENTP